MGVCRYVGEWVKGKRHGQGEFTSAHGYTYKGGWKDGMKAGTGVESTLPPGNSGTYVGDFLRDLKHGNGVMRYDSGGVYQGDWKAGVRQGQGRELFVSGAKYEGSYYNDMLNGEGFYEAPPVGRDERVKVYKRRLLMEAEKLLVHVRRHINGGQFIGKCLVDLSTHFLGSKVLDMFLKICRKGAFPPERCKKTIILLYFKTKRRISYFIPSRRWTLTLTLTLTA